MIGVFLIMRALPGKAEELATFWEHAAATLRTDEPGCLQISVIRSQSDPDEFAIFERYESQKAFDVHIATEFAKQAGPILQALRIAPVQRVVGKLLT